LSGKPLRGALPVNTPEPPSHDEAQRVAADRRAAVVSTTRPLSYKAQFAILFLLVALLLILVLLSNALFPPPAASTATRDALNVPDGSFAPTPRQWASFTIMPVQQMIFRLASETDGKIANDDDVTTPVYSPFTGRVTNLFAKAGDRVTRGDPLFAVQAAEFVQGQNDLIGAAATLRTARAQMNLAQTNEKRQHALFLAQGGALKDWQQSQVDLANAEGGLRSAEIALGTVRNRLRILGKSDQEIAAAETAPDPQQFNPEAIVVAPISGTVVQRQIGQGQNIVSQSSGGTTPVFLIGDLTRVWLLGNAREIDAPFIHVGDPVEVAVLAYPGRVFSAHISYIATSIDPNTHRLPVRAEVDNSDGALKPEMFASFTVIIGAGEASAAVPDSAVVHEGSSAHVWVAHPENKTITLRQIRTGRFIDGMVQVTEGLQFGESVVTRGSLFIDRATVAD
jgi:cobalt-zinc-cadmium efflux system membrane fusion protein